MDRLELHQILTDILKSNNVYYQPPQSIKLNYPCIIYSREKIKSIYANDYSYTYNTKYKIVLIYKNPDEKIVYDIETKLPMCSHDSHYISNNLYHDAFYLYT